MSKHAHPMCQIRGDGSCTLHGFTTCDAAKLALEVVRLRKQVDCLTNGNMEQGCGHDHE